MQVEAMRLEIEAMQDSPDFAPCHGVTKKNLDLYFRGVVVHFMQEETKILQQSNFPQPGCNGGKGRFRLGFLILIMFSCHPGGDEPASCVGG